MTSPARHAAKVLENRRLTAATHELLFTRAGFSFRAGEEIQIHGAHPTEDRAYSLAGGERDEALRILFRVIPDGTLSPKLAALAPGDPLAFTGPFGSFTLRDPVKPLWFIATGTGIAPLLSFLRSHASLRPTVLHGVRAVEDLYCRDEVEPRCAAYHPCVSGGAAPTGRVTDRLRGLAVPTDADIYLCGSNAMIVEVRRLLLERGTAPDRLIAEPYFYW